MRHLQSLLACALLALAALACAWPALDKSSLFTAAGSTTADTPQQTATVSGQSLPKGWTAMPAGARSTYLGIHGGTVPVSLLVSRDGMSLVSFVGQTGNDFLELLRRGYRVYVGQMSDGEVDFVAISSEETIYYQVAATTLEESTLERELAPLRKIQDNYPKYLLTLDELFNNVDYEGIKKRNVLEWLLKKSQ